MRSASSRFTTAIKANLVSPGFTKTNLNGYVGMTDSDSKYNS